MYIAGPMTGLPDYNYPAFHRMAALLRSCGYEVFNPAENHGGRTDLPLAEYYKIDLPQVCDADALVLLEGWEKSAGASLEVTLANVLDKKVYLPGEIVPMADGRGVSVYTSFDMSMPKTDESILQEAQRLVHGPRGDNYGHPTDDFARTGRMWGAILGLPDIPPETVGLCMAAVKISREVNRPKRDNRVDLAGYAETIDMIHNRDDR